MAIEILTVNGNITVRKLYKPTHVNHPSAIWVRQSENNYRWLYEHFKALCEEYTYRYGKIHRTEEKMSNVLCLIPANIPYNVDFTPPPLCMPDDCKVIGDNVESYRNYYNIHKNQISHWKQRPQPIRFTKKEA